MDNIKLLHCDDVNNETTNYNLSSVNPKYILKYLTRDILYSHSFLRRGIFMEDHIP